MISDINMESEFAFDSDIGYELYISYRQGYATLEHFLRYIKRWAVSHIRYKYMAKIGSEACEDLVQSVLMELWMIGEEHAIPYFGIDTFYRFLHTIAHRKMSRIFSGLYDDSHKYVKSTKYDPGYHRRYATPEDVEDRIFLEELPSTVSKRILSNFRLAGVDNRDAAKYIIDKVFRKQRIVYPWLRNRFSVKDPEFLVQHVKIRMRANLYEIRSEFPAERDSDIDILLEELRSSWYE